MTKDMNTPMTTAMSSPSQALCVQALNSTPIRAAVSMVLSMARFIMPT